ncbi:MAG: HD domain-containing phosphohydrolase [Planctomycetota bacterium]
MRRILMIDDESNVLNSFRRTLAGRYHCVFAQGAAEALAELQQCHDFAVVVTDMRMPGMDGLALIEAAKRLAPDAVYLMLTGNSEIQTAIDAVNKGQVFRFLTKPCPPEILHPAFDAALRQSELIHAEKTMLRRTVTGSVRLVAELVELIHPALAERHARVRRNVRQLVETLALPDPWAHEVAATLSQVGRCTLPPELANAEPDRLDNPRDRDLLQRHPARAAELLEPLPRLALPRQIIAGQYSAKEPTDTEPDYTAPVWGACVLRVALAFDQAYARLGQEVPARQAVREQLGQACPTVTAALTQMPTTEHENSSATLQNLRVDALRPGMFTAAPVMLADGRSLMARGRELTPPLIAQFHSHVDLGLIVEPLDILVPHELDDPLEGSTHCPSEAA